MAEEILRRLGQLLAQEGRLAHRLSMLEPGGEMDDTLQHLLTGQQQWTEALSRLDEVSHNLTGPALERMSDLKRQREAHCTLLQKALQAIGKRLDSLHKEKKALSLYRPAMQRESSFVDRRG